MTATINHLATELGEELDASLETLQTRLAKVESELDLECRNLRNLVNSKDPDLNRQLDALSESITSLHDSLREVRENLETAKSDSDQIEVFTHEAAFAPEKPAAQKSRETIDARTASKIRHDEEITLSGIFRAFFMADEPAQRFNRKK